MTTHETKQKVVAEYQKITNARILIETGTYNGDMISAQIDNFDIIYSIELSENLFHKAQVKFMLQKVKLYHGDSSEILPTILNEIKEPVIFWLDGHYSSGITARGKKDTPIREELAVIMEHEHIHTILIDDARMFVGENDYPTLTELENMAWRYKMVVKDDIIRLT